MGHLERVQRLVLVAERADFGSARLVLSAVGLKSFLLLLLHVQLETMIEAAEGKEPTRRTVWVQNEHVFIIKILNVFLHARVNVILAPSSFTHEVAHLADPLRASPASAQLQRATRLLLAHVGLTLFKDAPLHYDTTRSTLRVSTALAPISFCRVQ